MRWRMVLEEYNPELIYLKGADNIVADALSRLDLIPDDSDEASDSTSNSNPTIQDYLDIRQDELPADVYPLRMSLLSSEQRKDTTIQAKLRERNSGYIIKEVRGGIKSYDVVYCNDKIVVPRTLRKRLINWYHTTLMHPGINRTERTIGMHSTWPKLHDDVEKICKHCKTCQLTKKTTIKYGH